MEGDQGDSIEEISKRLKSTRTYRSSNDLDFGVDKMVS